MTIEHWTEGVIDPEDWYVYLIVLGPIILAGIFMAWKSRHGPSDEEEE